MTLAVDDISKKNLKKEIEIQDISLVTACKMVAIFSPLAHPRQSKRRNFQRRKCLTILALINQETVSINVK
jgi:hypothetical protein